MSIPVNLIFDGNYLFHKTRFIVMQNMKSSHKFLDKKEEQEIFIRKVAMDFVSAIKKFNGFSSIIFAKDSFSWRKEMYSEYKANRVKDDSDMNWEIFYELMDEFMEILKTHGVIITSLKGAEGDDLMYLWTDFTRKHKLAHSIIVTADQDLSQLVNCENDIYTIIYNSNSKNIKLVTPLGFNNWLAEQTTSDGSVFSVSKSAQAGNDGVSVIKNLIGQMEMVEIDPNLVVLDKVFCGDKGDNIPSVWKWINKNGNVQKITNRYIQRLYEYILAKEDNFNILDLMSNEFLRNGTRKKLEELTKIKIDPVEYDNNLIQNIKLVYLHHDIIPSGVIKEFDDVAESIVKNKTKKFDGYKLLEGTRFEKNIEILSDVFNI